MYMADTLSRAYLTHSTPPVRQADVKLIDSVPSATAIETEDADAICFIAVSDEKKREIKEATRDDQILQLLRTMIQKGWPDKLHMVPHSLRPYYNYRDELSLADGFIIKSHRPVVLTS